MDYTQTNDVLEQLNKNGFLTIGNFFTNKEINILKTEIDSILNENEPITQKPPVGKYKQYDIDNTIKTAYRTFVKSIIGNSKKIDDICERFFSDHNIKNLFELILGKNYKVYTFAVRKANDSSNFVGLHQDGYNQFSLAILLDDIDKNHPTTTFVSGSHKIPFKLNSHLETINIKYFKKLLTPAVGKAGDILLFYNRTFHGLQQGKNGTTGSVILCCLHPTGTNHRPWDLPDKSKYNDSFINGLGDELKRLFDPNMKNYENINNKLFLKNNSEVTKRSIDNIILNDNVNFAQKSLSIFWASLVILKNTMKPIYLTIKKFN